MPPLPRAEIVDQEFCSRVDVFATNYIRWKQATANARAPQGGEPLAQELTRAAADEHRALWDSGYLFRRGYLETTMPDDPLAQGACEVETIIPGAEIIRIYGAQGPLYNEFLLREDGALEEYLATICQKSDESMIVAIPVMGARTLREEGVPSFVLFRATPGSVEKLTE